MGCFGFVWDGVKFFNMKRVDLSLTCKQENERKLIVGLMMLIYIYIYIYIKPKFLKLLQFFTSTQY